VNLESPFIYDLAVSSAVFCCGLVAGWGVALGAWVGFWAGKAFS
jgi:hypothetical protein